MTPVATDFGTSDVAKNIFNLKMYPYTKISVGRKSGGLGELEVVIASPGTQ